MIGNTSKDGTGTPYWVVLNSQGQLVIVPAWTKSLQSDTDANDSDKSFTVPASTEWLIHSIWVELTSTGTAGNRQLEIEVQDSTTDIIMELRAGAVQAASLTRYYLFAPQLADLTSFRDTDLLMTPMPELILPASYILRVYDKAAIDAAADDMVVHVQMSSRSV